MKKRPREMGTYGTIPTMAKVLDGEMRSAAHDLTVTRSESLLNDLVDNATPIDTEKPLTPLQLLCAMAMAHGAKPNDIGTRAGIQPATISHWYRHLPQFQAEVRRIQIVEGLKSVGDRLEAIVPRAIDTMEAIMEDANVNASTRLQAAVSFIEQVRGKPKQPIEQKTNLLETLLTKITTESEESAIEKYLESIPSGSKPDSQPN